MDRPQFTLRNMLIAVGYFALACGTFRIAQSAEWLLGFLLSFAFWASVGAGVGALFNAQREGAIMAVVISMLVGCIGTIILDALV